MKRDMICWTICNKLQLIIFDSFADLTILLSVGGCSTLLWEHYLLDNS